MAEKREIISCSIFGAQALFIRRLWEPETKDFLTQKPLDKPRYSVSIRVPKTAARWQDEKIFASVTAACRKLYADNFKGIPIDSIGWPVKDGDRPNAKSVVTEWAAGHWLMRADTTSPEYTTIEAVQNGKAVELSAAKMGGRTVVKDGDLCILTVGLAKSGRGDPAIKTYLNGIVFTGPGDAIKLGSRPSSEDLLRQAREQGLAVNGVGGAPASSAQPSWSGMGGSASDDIPF